MKKGFTLIELVIAITLFAIISGIGINIIYNVFYGYSDTKIKNFLYNEAKFTFERLDKELHSSIPNSVRANGELLQYLLFSKSFFYRKKSDTSIVIYDNINNVNLNNAKVVIYPLSYTDIFNSDSNSQKIYTINNITQHSNHSYTLNLNKSIIEDSPYHRCYIIDTPVTIFKENDKLIRCFGYTVNSSNGKNSGTCNILTNYVDNISFKYTPGINKREGMLRVSITLRKNDTTIDYKNEVHFRNVP